MTQSVEGKDSQKRRPKILILACAPCAYPAADAMGQSHLEYPANTYVIRVPSPVLFPDDFYYRCFEKGIDAILVMTCGVECPYQGAYERLAARIDRVYKGLKERGINPQRIKISAICTVCTKAFLKEVNDMCRVLEEESGASQ